MQPEEYNRPIRRPSGDHTEHTRDDRSLADLFRELTQETRVLIRQEINLAKTEASEKASAAGKDAGLVGAGGAVAYVGFIVLSIGLALLIGTFMPEWLAFMIVGTVVAVAGYALAQSGLNALKQTDFTLARTAETLEEDKQWMKEEVRQMREGNDRRKTAEHARSAR